MIISINEECKVRIKEINNYFLLVWTMSYKAYNANSRIVSEAKGLFKPASIYINLILAYSDILIKPGIINLIN